MSLDIPSIHMYKTRQPVLQAVWKEELAVTRQSFIKGAMILLAAGIFTRILGFIPRIMLPRMIGAEGVGLYQLSYPMLMLILTIITGGIPLAVAKMVAEADSTGKSQQMGMILKVALAFVVSLGSVFTIAAIWAAPWVSEHLLSDSRVYYSFVTMIPVILMVSISSVFRGYFQGKQNMIPTALSTTVETIVRCAGTLALAYLLLPYGLEKAAAGAMAGLLLGELAGLFILLIQYQMNRQDEGPLLRPPAVLKHQGRTTLKQLLSISIPVTGSRLVGSASYFLESIMIIQSLALIGIATSQATTLYGMLTGMIIPVVLLPTALTYSLSVSLIPSLSEAAARNDMKTIRKRLLQSLRMALVTGAPFAVIMMLLAEPLCIVLYNDHAPAEMLKWVAPVAIFIYLQGPLQAALQALDKPGTALYNTFIGAAVKLILIFLLTAKAELGIKGAVIAICTNMILVTVLHWRSIAKLTQLMINPTDFIKVLTGCIVMAVSLYAMTVWSPIGLLQLDFLLTCTAGIIIYVIVMIIMGMIDKHDMSRIPGIGRWLK
ncbi:stage V sporulation protein B [Marinicrinis lubricantis]|uniref:Stage V sporulation protein B n=1 Tax=Marinicrinis lubricantis TaxID=2086470 RepID=A0ABW1ITP2_9BACL